MSRQQQKPVNNPQRGGEIPIGPPRIALKLTPAAHEKQQNDPDFIAGLVHRVWGDRSIIAPRVEPLIPASQRDAGLVRKISLAAELDPAFAPPNFDVWYQVRLGSPRSTAGTEEKAECQSEPGEPKLRLPEDTLRLIHGLQNLDEVESAHALHEGPPPAVDPTDDPRSRNEGFLDAAPDGINARYAWEFPGGDGAGVGIVDMEQGWNLNHEDLAAANITLISGTNAAYYFHGTSVLGEMLMIDNQLGGVGIVPAAKGRVISQHRPDGSYNTAATILDAAANMSFGDILLLEAQEFDPVSGNYYWPCEVADANFEAIQVATALGITVVEAGCNGAYDLDAYLNPLGRRIFDRASPDYRESGAIMVGGGSSTVPHTRMWYSNFGSRIDVYAWGENVDTTDTDGTGTDNTLYTGFFNGTSSASPIVTGAAAAVQGLAKAAVGYPFSPLQVRTILTTGGTPSGSPATDLIGVMPDLRAIIDGPLLNITPDLFVRDYVGDTGSSTSGAVSRSPDIIVRQSAATDPQAVFGPGSGTEDNVALSEPVLSGREHSLYVRLQNRGGAPAPSSRTTVYWSEAATLVTPNLWREIGSVVIPSVPTGLVLTVSPRLAWPAAAVPPTGHYCFVAIAGTTGDPVPVLPTTFPDFVRFVQANNNVAWRNFNVVAAPPSAPTANGFHRFPIRVPGAFDAPRRFVLRAAGTLPRDSVVRLELPATLARALHIQQQHDQPGKEEGETGGKKVVVRLHPFGKLDVGAGILPVGSLAACELYIRVPVDMYKRQGNFEFYLSQEWEGVEVGRVTYRFGPVTKVSRD